jgi:hypothetical protein
MSGGGGQMVADVEGGWLRASKGNVAPTSDQKMAPNGGSYARRLQAERPFVDQPNEAFHLDHRSTDVSVARRRDEGEGYT